MKANGIDIYVVPTDDFHQSEYVGEHFKCRAFISGFTGSAGTILVTQDFAGLWTDGRYFLQAEAQLAIQALNCLRWAMKGVRLLKTILCHTLKKGQCLGFDGRTVNARNGQDYVRRLREKGASVNGRYDLVDESGLSVRHFLQSLHGCWILLMPASPERTELPDPSGNGREESGLVCTDFSG